MNVWKTQQLKTVVDDGRDRREEGVLEVWSVGRLFLPLECLQERKENCLCKESMAHWCGRVDVGLVG